MGREFFICILLIAATLVAFWQVGNHEFVNFDDPHYVSENLHVQAGLTSESVRWAFTSDYISVWMPLTWLSFMLDFELYGLNPGGFHFTNLLLHLTSTVLLFLILKGMTGAVWRSGFVAALFALHPLHVESVAWITERKDVLSTLFWMLTLGAYSRYVKNPGVARYLLIVLAFALGLMCKPMLVTLPFVLLLLDYWPLNRLESGDRSALFLLVEKTPLFALSALASFVTIVVQRRGGALGSFHDFPLVVSIPNALVAYVTYIGKMIWPQNLAVFYPHPGASLSIWHSVGAGLLLVAISVVVLRQARRHPYLLVGWLWYLGTLVPMIGLVQTGKHAMADRFTYVPLIGLFIMLAWTLPELLKRYQRGPQVVGLLAVAVVLLSTLLTWKQVSYWRNTFTLFQHAATVNDRNYVAHINVGHAFAAQGKNKEALAHFLRAVEVAPDSAAAHSNLGNVLARQGRNEEAVAHLYKALELNPELAGIHNNLGNVFEKQGRIKEALHHYHLAIKGKPDFADAYFNLGTLKARQGKYDEAIDHFSKALQLQPDFAEVHNSLGVALALQKRLDQAIEHFREAVRIAPGFHQAQANLQLALQEAAKNNPNH